MKDIDPLAIALVSIGVLVFLAHLFASLFSKKMIPDVLLLLLLGLLLGPIFGFISPNDFGKFGGVFTTITLVIILFEGGTSMSIKTLQASWKSTMTLTLISFVVLVAAVTVIAAIGFGFHFLSALTLGAILGGTSSAVVIPLAQKLPLGEETKTALVLESAITDVLCIVLALACVGAYSGGAVNLGKTIGDVIASFVIAAVIGIAGAMVWSRLLSLIRNVQNSIFTTSAFVFVIYGITQMLEYSGAIAALSFGITMANLDRFKGFLARKVLGTKAQPLNIQEMVFLKEFAFLLKTFFFVYIGISILFENVKSLIFAGILTGVLYLLRLIVAKFASPKSANVFDKSTVSLMTPKGLAAAVLAAVPEAAGMPEGEMIKNIVYGVVLFSIVITSVLIIINSKSNGLQRFYGLFFGTKQPNVPTE